MARAKTIEEIYVKNIEAGIRSLDFGTKRPHEVNINKDLAKLSMINEGLFDDLQNKYSEILEKIERKKIKDLYK
jgi:hypothetical protein